MLGFEGIVERGESIEGNIRGGGWIGGVFESEGELEGEGRECGGEGQC